MTGIMQRRLVISVAVAVTLLAWAPLLGVLLSTALASAFHCRLDEGSVHACPIAGLDAGPLLYDLFVAGWLMLIALPFMLATGLAWVVWLIVTIMRRVRRKNASTAAG